MSETERAPATFTEAVTELEAAGYDSMGFSIEDGAVVCLECNAAHDQGVVGVGGMLRYATGAGEGHVFALACPDCSAHGLLFAGPEAMAGGTGDIIDALTARLR